MAAKKRNNKKKRKPLSLEERKLRQAKSAFKRKIRNTFVGAGFTYIPTNDKEMTIGFRKIELDSLFIYENVWLVCEDTIKTSDIRDHIRTKNEAIDEIKSNLQQFIEHLVQLFPDKGALLTEYNTDRIKLFGLYISKEEVNLSPSDELLFNNLVFVQPKTLNYFQWIVSCIKLSARNEIFRFLELTNADIGRISSTSEKATITAPIIYPKEFTGIKNKVRVVSFMMCADDLLNTCYVLRKDNWSESIWLYQRLIEKSKIKKIREFLEHKGEAFYNNIIVALPDGVMFEDASGQYKTIEEISGLEGNCKLIFPKEMNSICIIDGQHRVFAHYESGNNSKQEKEIAKLRKQLHLLVTGLVFPENMSLADRSRIQSEIFLDINSNAKAVPQNILLQIKRIGNPIASESLAQFIIENLNKEGIFENKFQISSLDSGKIKTASIVRFALKNLVTITPTDGKQSLFMYWDGNKDALKDNDEDAIQSYVKFCSGVLRTYFGAIKANLKSAWENEDSKLLSVISINGFIIALTRQLPINGLQDFSYYNNVFSNWNIDFSKSGFPYTSSQYRKFSTQILKEAFNISNADLAKI